MKRRLPLVCGSLVAFRLRCKQVDKEKANGEETEEGQETQQDHDDEARNSGGSVASKGGGRWRFGGGFRSFPMSGRNARSLARVAQRQISKASPFKLRVRKSGIHRLGVFAAQNIPPGRKVVEYAGERISRRETRRRFLEGSRGRSRSLNYLAGLDSYWAIDGAAGGNGAELINHSCEPNLILRPIRKRLWLVSLRKVRAGEELRYDYHFAKNGERVRCHCGSPKCRGTINVR